MKAVVAAFNQEKALGDYEPSDAIHARVHRATSSDKVAAGAVGGKILTDHISVSSKKSISGLHTTTIYSRSNYGGRVGKVSRHMDIYKVDN